MRTSSDDGQGTVYDNVDMRVEQNWPTPVRKQRNRALDRMRMSGRWESSSVAAGNKSAGVGLINAFMSFSIRGSVAACGLFEARFVSVDIKPHCILRYWMGTLHFFG